MGSSNIKVQAKKELIDKYGEEVLTKLATEGFPSNISNKEQNRFVEKMENLILKDGRKTEDLIFEILELAKQEDIEKFILKIIDLVKVLEKEINGLNDELISFKYTHGHCFALTNLISCIRKELLGLKTICKSIGDGSFSHVAVRVKDPDKIEDFIYFDINGRKTYIEMEKFIIDELMSEEEKQSNKGKILSCETYEGNNDNIITALITKKLYEVLENQKNNKL